MDQNHALATASADRIGQDRPIIPDSELDPQPGFAAVGFLVGALGGLLTGVGMVAALSSFSLGQRAQGLQRVALDEVETAAQSLLAGRAAALVEGAKACRRPLGFLVVQATGKAFGTVRFRSGAYVSPSLQLGAQAERIALPFPAPLEAGHGQILVENRSEGAEIFLIPGIRLDAGPSTRVINVRWDPKAPC